MRRVHNWGWPAFGVLAIGAGSAAAGIAYDNITGKAGKSVLVSSDDEFADDTTLNASAGLTITAVRARLYNASNQPYTGELRFWIYGAGAGQPGSLLGSSVAPIKLAAQSEGTFEVPFANLTVPSAALWTGWQIPVVGPQAQVGVMLDANPSVGSSTALQARHYPDTTWGISNIPDSNFMFQIVTVPAPASATALGVLALGAVGARRRR